MEKIFEQLSEKEQEKVIKDITKFFKRESIFKQLQVSTKFLLPHKKYLNLELNIGGGSYYDGKKVVIGLPNYMLTKTKEEIFSALKAIHGHECEHGNSSDLVVLEKYLHEVSEYLCQKYNFHRSIAEKVGHYVQNSVEDGRIEKRLVNRLKGFFKHIKYFRGMWWKAQPVRGESEANDFLFAICTVATTGLYPLDWEKYYKGSRAEEMIEKIRPLIIKSINDGSHQVCCNHCKQIIEEIGDYIAELLQDQNMMAHLMENLVIDNHYSTSESNQSEQPSDGNSISTHFRPEKSNKKQKKDNQEEDQQDQEQSGQGQSSEDESQDEQQQGQDGSQSQSSKKEDKKDENNQGSSKDNKNTDDKEEDKEGQGAEEGEDNESQEEKGNNSSNNSSKASNKDEENREGNGGQGSDEDADNDNEEENQTGNGKGDDQDKDSEEEGTGDDQDQNNTKGSQGEDENSEEEDNNSSNGNNGENEENFKEENNSNEGNDGSDDNNSEEGEEENSEGDNKDNSNGEDSSNEDNENNSDGEDKDNQNEAEGENEGEDQNSNEGEGDEDKNKSDKDDADGEDEGQEDDNQSDNNKSDNNNQNNSQDRDQDNEQTNVGCNSDFIDQELDSIRQDALEEAERALSNADKEDEHEAKRKAKEAEEDKANTITSEELDEIAKEYGDDYIPRFGIKKFKSSKAVELPMEVKKEAKKFKKEVEDIFKNKRVFNSTHRRRGVLDTSSLWQIGVKDYNCFSKKGNPQNTDYAIYVLNDGSGSMTGKVDGRASKWFYASKASAIIEEGIKEFIPFKIATFSSGYDDNIHHIVSNFHEKGKENKSWSFYHHYSPNNGNKDGHSIRVATKELMGRPERNKLLIVLSDGLPSAYVSQEKGQADVRDAVREARKNGVKVVSICFGDEAHRRTTMDVYKMMYQTSIISCDPKDISSELIRVLKREITK